MSDSYWMSTSVALGAPVGLTYEVDGEDIVLTWGATSSDVEG